MQPLVDAETDLQPGDQVGDYRVDGRLGKGGFGAVYSAVHPVIGARVAIKVLSRKFSAEADIVSRFVAEARAVNQIRHPNIIDIFGFGRLDDGRQYLVMELLAGSTLEQLLRQRGRLAGREAMAVLRPLARALDAAHAAGIAHRDLKPENVFVSSDGEGRPLPKLLDFGIAKLLGPEEAAGHHTATGAPLGTPLYMSPEQCRGKGVDHRTDIYSFGVMAYQVLTGALPFVGDVYMDILLQHMNDEPEPPSRRVPELGAAVDAAVAAMMAKSPAARPQTLGEACARLAAALGVAGESTLESMLSPVASTGGGARVDPMAATHATPAPSAQQPIEMAPTMATPGVMTPVPAQPAEPAAVVTREARRGPWLTVGSAVVVAAGLAVVVMASRGGGGGGVGAGAGAVAAREAPPAADAAAVLASPPDDAAVAFAPPPETITLTVTGAPDGTEVRDESGELLGTLPGPITLPRGSAPLKLRLVKKGYKSQERELVPDADGKLEVKLVKERPKAKGKKGGKGGAADEIGDF